MPVPTAVPPKGISNNLFSKKTNVFLTFFNCDDQAENS